MIVVKVDSIRQAWRNARNDLSNRVWKDQQMSRSSAALNGDSFWKTLGRENGMVVKFDRFMQTNYGTPIPVIAEIEFKDEASYAWFMLRWA
jgi:hypothetical protein